MKDRFNEEVRLRKKFENIMKELKMQQDKEVLALKGQFKSKGGLGSPVAKSKFLQSRWFMIYLPDINNFYPSKKS